MSKLGALFGHRNEGEDAGRRETMATIAGLMERNRRFEVFMRAKIADLEAKAALEEVGDDPIPDGPEPVAFEELSPDGDAFDEPLPTDEVDEVMDEPAGLEVMETPAPPAKTTSLLNTGLTGLSWEQIPGLGSTASTSQDEPEMLMEEASIEVLEPPVTQGVPPEFAEPPVEDDEFDEQVVDYNAQLKAGTLNEFD